MEPTFEAQRILEIAAGYVGKEEIPGNRGFHDIVFEEEMRAVGWRPPWAWCALFSTLVWRKAYGTMNSIIEAETRNLFSPSATAIYNNFRADKRYNRYVSTIPTPGSIITFRLGKGWEGHSGIVESVNGEDLICIEGNTNSQGGREGIEVARMKRKLDYNYKGAKSLNLVGFIHPPRIDNHT